MLSFPRCPQLSVFIVVLGVRWLEGKWLRAGFWIHWFYFNSRTIHTCMILWYTICLSIHSSFCHCSCWSWSCCIKPLAGCQNSFVRGSCSVSRIWAQSRSWSHQKWPYLTRAKGEQQQRLFVVTSIWNCLNNLNISKPSSTMLHKLHQHPTSHVVCTLNKTFRKHAPWALSSWKSNFHPTNQLSVHSELHHCRIHRILVVDSLVTSSRFSSFSLVTKRHLKCTVVGTTCHSGLHEICGKLALWNWLKLTLFIHRLGNWQ